jgi:hypothetical protein
MMKAIIQLVFCLLLVSPLAGQENDEIKMPLDENNGLITYQEVVNVAGIQDSLFNRCSSWLHTFYANPWEATKVRDQASGIIKIQHQFRVYDYGDDGIKRDAGMVLYSMKIEFKQDRYRFTIDNLLLKTASRYPIENWLDKSRQDYDVKYQAYLKQIDQFFRNDLIPSLKAGMLPKEEIKEAEW